MAYAPIAFTAPNYRDNANEWIKAYEPGTTTPKVMALESNGGTQVAKLQLNADGFIVSAGAALVIPYLSGAYDLWLFPTEAEADANNTANAIRLADDILGVLSDLEIEALLINDLSQAYEFATVAEMKSSLIDFPVGKKLFWQGYYAESDSGSNWGIVKLGVHIEDGGSILTLADGKYVQANVCGNSINVAQWGIVGFQSNNSAQLQLLVNFATGKQKLVFNKGEVRLTSKIVVPNTGIMLEGSDRTGCAISTDGDFTVFQHSLSFNVKDLLISQQTGYRGIAFGTEQTDSNTAQAGYCNFKNVRVIGFHYSWWWRTSLWSTFKNCRSKSLVGVRFARSSNPYDRGVAPAPGGWNIFSPTLGWFHNQGSMDNMLFEDVECGVWGCPMGYKFGSITTQRQNQSMANNIIIPITEPPTGIWLHSGIDGTRGNWTNSIDELYAEACRRPVYIQDIKVVRLGGGFVQGNTTADKYITSIHVNNSTVYSEGLSGQDWFQYKAVLENAATLYGSGAGAVSGNVSLVDATSRLLQNREQEAFKSKYFFNSSAIQDYTIPVPLNNKSHYEVFVGGLFNGSAIKMGACDIFRWTNDALSKINMRSGAQDGFTIAISGGKVVISTTTAYSTILYIVINEVSSSISQETMLLPD